MSNFQPPAEAITFNLPDEASTRHLGTALADAMALQMEDIVANGALITLSGELGAGKTALVRALLRHLGVQGTIRSPTFTLLEPYAISSLNFYHIDLYRFGQLAQGAAEFVDAGFRDLFGPTRVVLAEWPERACGMLPTADLAIALSALPSTTATLEAANAFVDDAPRQAVLHPRSARGQAWLNLIQSSLSVRQPGVLNPTLPLAAD